MTLRQIGISILLLSGLLLTGCSKQEINTKFNYIVIMKRASMAQKFPNGFLQLGTMIEEQGKSLITSDIMKEKVKAVEITYPNGIKKTIDTQNIFNTNAGDFWSGYVVMGITEKQCAWTGVDVKYNALNLPLEGEYSWELTSIDGHKTKSVIKHTNNRSQEITGFPTNIKYDVKTRTISWKGFTDNSIRYRVYLFKGEKPEQLEDWSQMLFSTTPSMITGTKCILPDYVILEKGQKYYALVEAWRIPYFNVQDKKDQVAVFTAE